MNRKPFKVQGSRLGVGCCSYDEGFTLVELLVSAGLSLFVLGVVYSVYRVQTRTVKSQESRLVATEDARAALDLMVREIRNAGYTPAGAACAGVVDAMAQRFQFRLDPNNTNCTDANEDITYEYQSPGPQNCQAGSGDILRTANGTAAPISNCNVPTAAGNFSFIYYPQQTGAAAPPPYCYAAAGDLTVGGVVCNGIVTANLANIQRVTISLTVRSASPDTEFGGGQLNATMASNADLRNRGLPQP